MWWSAPSGQLQENRLIVVGGVERGTRGFVFKDKPEPEKGIQQENQQSFDDTEHHRPITRQLSHTLNVLNMQFIGTRIDVSVQENAQLTTKPMYYSKLSYTKFFRTYLYSKHDCQLNG